MSDRASDDALARELRAIAERIQTRQDGQIEVVTKLAAYVEQLQKELGTGSDSLSERLHRVEDAQKRADVDRQ
jgi:hypothetical protein